MRLAILCAAFGLLFGCRRDSPELTRRETLRLKASFEPHRAAYLESVAAANRLRSVTLGWLDGPAAARPRTFALSEARALTEKWARIYFVPRQIHGALRFDDYSSPSVKAAQRLVLNSLQRSYFELHDYQRYAQYAAESGLHDAPPGRLPVQLVEFGRRLRARQAFADEVYPILDALGDGTSPSAGSVRTPASASDTAR